MSKETLSEVFQEHIPILEAPPKISLLIDEQIKDIPNRFLPLGSKNQILSPSNKKELLDCLKNETDPTNLWFLGSNKFENNLNKLKQDIQDIFDGIVQKTQELGIREEELTPFYSDIIEIYRLVIRTPLPEIRSEINRQVNQIVLIIETRRLSESTNDSAGGILQGESPRV